MSDIQELAQIRQRLQKRLRDDPQMHIRVDLQHPKVHLENAQVRLTGVYAHIFQVEAEGKRYTLSYADVLVRRVELLD